MNGILKFSNILGSVTLLSQGIHLFGCIIPLLLMNHLNQKAKSTARASEQY